MADRDRNGRYYRRSYYSGAYDRGDFDYGSRSRSGSYDQDYDYDWRGYGGYGRGDYGSRGRYGSMSDRDYDWRGHYSSAYDRDYDPYSSRGRSGSYDRNEDYSSRDYGGYGRRGYGEPTRIYTEAWWIPGPLTGRGPRGYQRSDERIQEDVNDRLAQHGQIDASDIEVKVKNGEVTVTGTVNSRPEKRMAEDTAESVWGVREIHNQLRVKQKPPSRQTRQNQQNRQR